MPTLTPHSDRPFYSHKTPLRATPFNSPLTSFFRLAHLFTRLCNGPVQTEHQRLQKRPAGLPIPFSCLVDFFLNFIFLKFFFLNFIFLNFFFLHFLFPFFKLILG